MTNFGPSGQLIYDRTYSRVKPNGDRETWDDTVKRVVDGNLGLVDQRYHLSGEREALIELMTDFKVIPAGRHLWASGVPGRQYLFNCHVSHWNEKITDHFEFTFLRLMEGGGVGASYSNKYLEQYGPIHHSLAVEIVCDPEHPDYQTMKDAGVLSSRYNHEWAGAFEVEDSREGWASALVDLIETHYRNETIHYNRVYDVSNVREAGRRLKTFGGRASGPLPLAKMLREVSEILGDRSGLKLDGIGAMEIDHAIAECVVSGGNRRSARMAMMHWDDWQIFDFLACKQDTGKHWSTNISVEVDAEFWQQNAGGPLATAKRGDIAREVLRLISEGMVHNGEPGFWDSSLSNVGEVDPVVSTNPCTSERTWVLTSDGPKRVRDLVGVPFTAVVDGKPFDSDDRGFYKTGHKSLYKLQTDAGYSIEVTANQELYNDRRELVKVKDMRLGDRILLTDNFGVVPWAGYGDFNQGYAVGHFIGDGTFGAEQAILASWPGQGNEESEVVLSDYLSTLPGRSDWSGWHWNTNHLRMSKKSFTDQLTELGVVRGNKCVTEKVEAGSYDFCVGVLRGLFDTDGHVEGNKRSGFSVRLSSVDPGSLEATQRMLARLGIKSSIRGMYPAREKEMPGGVYQTKASYRLIVSGRVFVDRFSQIVGFHNTKKAEKLDAAINSYKRGPYEPRLWVKFQGLEYIGEEDVYDCTIPGPYDYDGNGLLVRDCGEIPLTPWENCNLGHINLAAFVDSTGGFSAFDLMKAHQLMTRFLIRATYGDVNDPKQAEQLAKQRRIGVGHLGVASFLAKVGIRYSAAPHDSWFKELLRSLANTVEDAASEYSFDLRIPMPVKTRTVAPTGTIAKMPGVSEGIHPIFSRYFIRRIRFSTVDPDQVATLQEYMQKGYNVVPDIYADNTAVVEIPTKDTLVEEVSAIYGPEQAEYLVESADELSLGSMLAFQAMYQMCWADNAVSFTANVDPERYTAQDVATELKHFAGVLKGATVFPEESRPLSPYERLTKAEYEAALVKDVSDGVDPECSNGSCPVR